MPKPKTDAQPDPSLPRRVRDSIIRGPLPPTTDRERKLAVLDSMILHLHPATVPEKTLKFTLTWGLGGMSAILMVILMKTVKI